MNGIFRYFLSRLILCVWLMPALAGYSLNAFGKIDEKRKGAQTRNHAGMEETLLGGAFVWVCKKGGGEDEIEATSPKAVPGDDSFPSDEEIDFAAHKIAEEWMEHLSPFLIGQPPGVARDSLIELVASGMAQRRLMDERREDLANEIQDHYYAEEEEDPN